MLSVGDLNVLAAGSYHPASYPGRIILFLTEEVGSRYAIDPERGWSDLAEDGIEAEVVELQWLRPFDVDSIAASVERTGRLLVVEEQVHVAGWGASLISELTLRGHEWKQRPRMAGKSP